MSIALSSSSTRRYGAAAPARSGQAERPRRRPFTVLAVSALALASGIAGCGGSSGNGVAAKSPDAILGAATNAVRDVQSVHVAGSVVSGGAPVAFDLNLAAGRGAAGRMSQNGLDFRIIVLKHEVYINGSDPFWQRFGGAAAVQLFHGKWLKGPATGQFAGVARLTDIRTLFSAFSQGHGKLAKEGTSTLDGQKVIAVKDTTEGGTLYVATTGKPYPIQVSGASADSSGRIVFDRYDQSISLSPPRDAIDISKLAGTQG